MNYDIIGEIRDERNRGQLKGTCFLINSKYAVTAAHVLEGIEKIEDIHIILKFIEITCKVKKIIYTNYSNIDFLIFELDTEIEKEIDYSEIYVTVPIEQGEFWETTGYPEDYKFDADNTDNKYTYLNGNINREVEYEKCDYELIIKNQKPLSDWQGLSGAPVIINNKIVGVITDEHVSKNLMNTIKIVSLQKIIEFLLDNNEKEALEVLSYKCKNLLNDRIGVFRKECEEKFLYFNNVGIDIKSDCFILKPQYKCKDVVDLIDLFLRDYANELRDLILLEDENLMTRRKQAQIIERAANELKSQLIEENKISLVLLWIILEGIYDSPRLASTYSLVNENLKQDIYISNNENGIKLLVSYSEMQEDILESIKGVLNNINKENLLGKKQERIIIWDELAINYLDFTTRLQLKEIQSDKMENDKLEIIILYSYKSDIYCKNQYKESSKNKFLIEPLIKKELDKYNDAIIKLCSQYISIKEMKINWILFPLESVKDFNQMLL